MRPADMLSAAFALYDSAASDGGRYNRFRQKHSGSIFGTDISQARNEIDRDNFNDRVLIDTASVAYNPGKIGGTEGA